MTANHTGGLGRQAVDWTVIASTGQRFVDFAPYVPSVNDAGLVAFQATLAGGGSGVFVGDGGPVEAAVTPPTVMRVTSHPDVNGSGKISFYGQLAADVDAVLLAGGGRHDVLEDTRGSFTAIGPLGPTMNEAGAVAFRANDIEHGAGVFVSRENGVATIATSSDGWSEFHGLPVVDDAGSVVFRATKGDRTHGIYTFGGGTLRTVVQTGEEFATLGLFPSVGADGAVSFAATLRGGGAGVFTYQPGGMIDSSCRMARSRPTAARSSPVRVP